MSNMLGAISNQIIMYKKLQQYTISSKTIANILQTGSNFGTKQRKKSGMGMDMVAERPRA